MLGAPFDFMLIPVDLSTKLSQKVFWARCFRRRCKPLGSLLQTFIVSH